MTTYREDIIQYTDLCMVSIEATLKAPRCAELRIEDIEQIIEQLRELSTKADLALVEARQDNKT